MKHSGDALRWTGRGDGLFWSDPDNWSGRAVPRLFDVVVILETNVASDSGIIIDTRARISDLCSEVPLTLSGEGSIVGDATLADVTIEPTDSTACHFDLGNIVINGAFKADTLILCGSTRMNYLNSADITGNIIMRGAAWIKIFNEAILTTGETTVSGPSTTKITNEGTHCVQAGTTRIRNAWEQKSGFDALLDFQYGTMIISPSAIWAPTTGAGPVTGSLRGGMNSAFYSTKPLVSLTGSNEASTSDFNKVLIGADGIVDSTASLLANIVEVLQIDVQNMGTLYLVETVLIRGTKPNLNGAIQIRLSTAEMEQPYTVIEGPILIDDLTFDHNSFFNCTGSVTVNNRLVIDSGSGIFNSFEMTPDSSFLVNSAAELRGGAALTSSIEINGDLTNTNNLKTSGSTRVSGSGKWQVSGNVNIETGSLDLDGINLSFRNGGLIINAPVTIGSVTFVVESENLSYWTGSATGELLLDAGSAGVDFRPLNINLDGLKEVPIIAASGTNYLTGPFEASQVGVRSGAFLTLVGTLVVESITPAMDGVIVFQSRDAVSVRGEVDVLQGEFQYNVPTSFESVLLQNPSSFVDFTGTSTVDIKTIQAQLATNTEVMFVRDALVGTFNVGSILRLEAAEQQMTLTVNKMILDNSGAEMTAVQIIGSGATLKIVDEFLLDLKEGTVGFASVALTFDSPKTILTLQSGIFRFGFGRNGSPLWDVTQGRIISTDAATLVTRVTMDFSEEFAPGLDVSGLDGTLDFVSRGGSSVLARIPVIRKLRVLSGSAVRITTPTFIREMPFFEGTIVATADTTINGNVELRSDSTIGAVDFVGKKTKIEFLGFVDCKEFSLKASDNVVFTGGITRGCVSVPTVSEPR